MKRVYLVFAVFLWGCAHDNYAVIPGGPGSPDNLKTTLRDCKHDVLARYSAGQSHTGALLFGAAGALADVDSGPMKASEINPAIEQCMKGKGYVGTSEN